MPRRITIASHLSSKELYQRYRQSKNAIEKSHYHIIWLLKQGKKTKEVAEMTGYSVGWIYELVWGYNRLGPASLGDKRRDNPGNTPLLNDQQQALLWEVLQEPPSDGGLWTGPKVAKWMSELLNRKIHPQRGWDYLRGLENVRRRTKSAHIEREPEEQEERKNKFRRPSKKLNATVHQPE